MFSCYDFSIIFHFSDAYINVYNHHKIFC
jgi:hypothetical protein